MLAVTAVGIDPNDPLSGLAVGERPYPAARDGWTTVALLMLMPLSVVGGGLLIRDRPPSVLETVQSGEFPVANVE